jgi:hypothetical protein
MSPTANEMSDEKGPRPPVTWRRVACVVGVVAAVTVGVWLLVLGVALYVGHRAVSSIDMPLLFSAINETDRPPPNVAAVPANAGGNPDGSRPTADQARAALVRMTEQDEAYGLKEQAKRIEAVQAHDSGNGEVSFGPWQCNLVSDKFQASFEYPASSVVNFGEFVKDDGGVWQAKVTKHLNLQRTIRDQLHRDK